MCRTAFILLFFCSVATSSLAEPLIAERDWTSSDGKTIRAELTEFVTGVGQFRTSEGRRFPIPDERLSQRDQAAVFAARMFDTLDVSTSGTSGTEFFYSTHIPRNQRSNLFSGYISFGDGRFSLELFVPKSSIDFRGWETVVFSNSQLEHTYKIGKSDTTVYGEGEDLQSRIRIFLRPNRDEPLIPIFLEGFADNSLKIEVRKGAEVHEVPLSEPEENALREQFPLFGQACELIRAGVLQREILSDQLETFKHPGGMDVSPENPATNPEELEPFREQLAREKYGPLTWTPTSGEAQAGFGLGWLGADLVIRTVDGEVRRVPHAEIDAEALQHIYEARIEESFDGKAAPVDSRLSQFIHPEWSDHDRQYRQCVFFSVLPDGRPYLIHNVWTTRFENQAMTSALINSDALETAVEVSAVPGETRHNPSGERIYSIVYNFLKPDEAEKLFSLANATSVSMRLNAGPESTTFDLKEEELFVTREGVALYQWHLALP